MSHLRQKPDKWDRSGLDVLMNMALNGHASDEKSGAKAPDF
jgi:hypothetical protein